MKKKGLVIALLTVFSGLISLNSCLYQNKEELFPPVTSCDTTTVTYSGVVEPLLKTNCYQCHDAASPSSGIPFEGYSNIKSFLDNNEQKFIGSLSHSPGFLPMPRIDVSQTNARKLDDCTLSKIFKWVRMGAPNN